MRVLISLQNRPLTMRIKEVMGKMKGFFFPFSPYTSAIHMDARLLACSNMPSSILA